MIELPVPSYHLARQIARDSVKGDATRNADGQWLVRGDRIFVDYRNCAAALGRPLTDEEKQALQFRDLPHAKNRQVTRFAAYVAVEPPQPMTAVHVRFPSALGRFLKREADARQMSVTQLVQVMTEFFFLTYGAVDDEVRAHVEGKFSDLTKWYGVETVHDHDEDSRVTHHRAYPTVSTALRPTPRWAREDS